jgi:Flp pilus assembly pilin Flp
MRKKVASIVLKLIGDQHGGEVLEYAIIIGLIVIAAIGIVAAIGNKVVANFSSINSSM